MTTKEDMPASSTAELQRDAEADLFRARPVRSLDGDYVPLPWLEVAHFLHNFLGAVTALPGSSIANRSADFTSICRQTMVCCFFLGVRYMLPDESGKLRVGTPGSDSRLLWRLPG